MKSTGATSSKGGGKNPDGKIYKKLGRDSSSQKDVSRGEDVLGQKRGLLDRVDHKNGKKGSIVEEMDGVEQRCSLEELDNNNIDK